MALVALLPALASAQESEEVTAETQTETETDTKVDPSKPTNFYSLVAANFEANPRRHGGDIYGARAEALYAPSEAHLILAELPLLYNTESKAFGLGDVRTRYFYLPYKNYERVFGAFGPSLDVFWPTGSYKDGLGSSSFVISPGLTAGLMFADWIQAFPVVSYQLTTKPFSSAVPNSEKRLNHGLNVQAIVPIVLHPKFFMQITPIALFNDLKHASSARYVQEALVQYQVVASLAVNAFYRGVFADGNHVARVGVTFYLL